MQFPSKVLEMSGLSVFYLLYLACHCTLACFYPDFMQTRGNAPSWFVKYHDDKTLEITVKHNNMTIKETRTSGYAETQILYRYCVRNFEEGKFMVKQVLNSNGEHNVRFTFRCVQFLKRSSTVVQMKISRIVDNRMYSHCSDSLLMLDKYPIISTQPIYEVHDCPISGGYDFKMYSPDDPGRPLCDDIFLPLRLESDCKSKEGMNFYFRRRNCIRKFIDGDIDEEPLMVKCVATWRYMHYTFSVVKWSGSEDYWCMRATFKDEEVYQINIYFTGICPPDSKTYEKMLILKHFKRHFVNNICEDEAILCKYENKFCSTDARDNCKLSCKLCNPEVVEQPCSFPEKFEGSWQGLDDPSRNAVIISNTTLTMEQSNLQWQCIKSEYARKARRRVLKLKFYTGCYPRFMCIDMELPAFSVLRYRTGSELTWPIESLGQVCEDRYFDYKPKLTQQFGIARTSGPWSYFINQQQRYVSCNLPWYIPNISSFIMYASGEPRNDGCLIHNAGHPGQFLNLSYTFRNSKNQTKIYKTRRYICLASIKFIGENDLLITQNIEDPSEYLCWTFVHDKNFDYVYLFAAEDCGNGTNMQLIHFNNKKALATLVITKRSNHCDFIENEQKSGMTRRSDNTMSSLTVDSSSSVAKSSILLAALTMLGLTL